MSIVRCRPHMQLYPQAGDVMPRTGGFRKLRWADGRRGKGRRGGLRVIYYWLMNDGEFWMFAIYDKDELENLTAEQEKALKKAIESRVEKTRYPMKKRDLFAELMQGVDEMAAQREGKITLRNTVVEDIPAPRGGGARNRCATGKATHVPGCFRQANSNQSQHPEKLGAGKVEAQCSGRLADQVG